MQISVPFHRFLTTVSIGACFCCLDSGAAEDLQAAPEPGVLTPGIPVAGAPPIRQSTAEILARERATPMLPRGSRVHPLPQLDFQNLPANQDSVNAPSWPPGGNGGPPVPLSPQVLSLDFTGATLSDTLSFPPDSMGAAGPSQFIVAVNGRIRSFTKSSGLADGVLNVNSDVFFNPVMTPPASNNFTSDPRIRYDRLSGRWFITMIDVPGQAGTSPNRVLLAVSDSGVITPASVWSFFYFQGDSSGFADYPTLGIDANALYMGVNIFSARGSGAFSDTKAFVVRKSSVLGAGPIVVTTFANLITKVQGRNTGPYSPQGVDNFDPAATEGYVIGVDAGLYGKLQLRRISNPAGTPSISANVTITVPLNGPTISVPHLGNTGGANGNLDGGDYRLLGAHLRNGHLWASENIAVDNTGSPAGTDTRMGVRWYDLNGVASGQTPAVAQSGTLYQPSAGNTTDQRCYWMGSIMVSGQGHAALGFSVAGAAEHINAGTAGRLASDPPGTLRATTLYTASSTAYNPPGDPGGLKGRRWGDYSYASLDPADDMTMWTIQEFCNATDSYAVQVAKLLAPLPAMPLSCNPASVAAGTSNANVVLTGLSNGDTSFFDPGPGFSNRISATIAGGSVILNAITYTDPTHLTLNLSVLASATGGARTIIVTNPDGQSATSTNGILTITTGANSPPVLTAIPNKTVSELSTLVFTNTAIDPDHDALAFSLDPGAPAGASVNPSSGVFTWTPSETQAPGLYTIGIRVTDSGSPPLSDVKTCQVTVNEVNSPPTLMPVPNMTVYAGLLLTVTNRATDPDIATDTLTFSLGPNPPPGSSIDSATGVFTWRPAAALANTTNTVHIIVTDNEVPPLSDTNSFAVTVLPPPRILSLTVSNGVVTISWSAIPGQSYTAQYNNNLNAPTWTDLLPQVTASSPVAAKTDSVGTNAHRYYRIRVP